MQGHYHFPFPLQYGLFNVKNQCVQTPYPDVQISISIPNLPDLFECSTVQPGRCPPTIWFTILKIIGFHPGKLTRLQGLCNVGKFFDTHVLLIWWSFVWENLHLLRSPVVSQEQLIISTSFLAKVMLGCPGSWRHADKSDEAPPVWVSMATDGQRGVVDDSRVPKHHATFRNSHRL